MQKIKVGIVGGTGYTGVELLRILSQHPHVQLVAITSRSEAGLPVAQMFPSLRGVVDLCFSDPNSGLLETCDVVFFCYTAWRGDGTDTCAISGWRSSD